MRKITETIVTAFLARKGRCLGNTTTNGTHLHLHGNAIAWHGVRNGARGVYMTLAGWGSVTTRERLNGLLAGMAQDHLAFRQRKGEQILRSSGVAGGKPQDRALSANEVVFVANADCATGLAAVTFELVPSTGRSREVTVVPSGSRDVWDVFEGPCYVGAVEPYASEGEALNAAKRLIGVTS